MLEYIISRDGSFKSDNEAKKDVLVFIVFRIPLFIITLGIIPFLLLQVLNTYQWTCLFFDQFCGDNRDPYRFSLVQSIISMCFVFSLFVAKRLGKASEKPDKKKVYPDLVIEGKYLPRSSYCRCMVASYTLP